MIDFSNRTMALLLAEQLQRVSNSLDKREGSMIQTALAPESWELEAVYLYLDKIQRSANVYTATGTDLDNITAERGINRKAATAANRLGKFNMKVLAGSRFSTLNGTNSLVFYTAADAVYNVTDGRYNATLICETAGTGGNDYTGNIIPVSFITGLTYAVMTSILVAGTDEETDDDLRARYILSLNETPFGGNIASYREFTLALDNIGAIQVYPHWSGAGTVLCTILDANFDIATSTLISTVQNLICPPDSGTGNPTPYGYGLAPIGAIATVSTATALTLNLTFSVSLATGYTINAIQSQAEEAFDNYILSVRKTWGTPAAGNPATFYVYVYISKIISLMLEIPGVLNVTNMQINGSSSDVHCIETAQTQQLPEAGTVVISLDS